MGLSIPEIAQLGGGGGLLIAAWLLRDSFRGIIAEWRRMNDEKAHENSRLINRIEKMENTVVGLQDELNESRRAEQHCRDDYAAIAEQNRLLSLQVSDLQRQVNSLQQARAAERAG